jgi:hypothetical protein
LLLSALIHSISGDIDSKKITTIRTQNINELLMDTQSDVHKIFVDAFNFDKLIYGMVGSGTKMASFFDSPYPIVSFSEDFDKSLIPEGDIVNRYYGFRLNNLFK